MGRIEQKANVIRGSVFILCILLILSIRSFFCSGTYVTRCLLNLEVLIENGKLSEKVSKQKAIQLKNIFAVYLQGGRDMFEVTKLLGNGLFLCLMFVSVIGQQPDNRTQPPAQTGTTQKDTNKSRQLSGPDREFTRKAVEGNATEVALAKMGATKATNAEVKQYAQRLAEDHSKAGEELRTWATNNGLTLPTETEAKPKEMAKWDKLSGAEFDREFMHHMIKDHQKDVAMYERQSRESQNTELKAWVDKTLPTLREHLRMAKEVGGKVGVSATEMGDKGRKGGR